MIVIYIWIPNKYYQNWTHSESIQLDPSQTLLWPLPLMCIRIIPKLFGIFTIFLNAQFEQKIIHYHPLEAVLNLNEMGTHQVWWGMTTWILGTGKPLNVPATVTEYAPISLHTSQSPQERRGRNALSSTWSRPWQVGPQMEHGKDGLSSRFCQIIKHAKVSEKGSTCINYNEV